MKTMKSLLACVVLAGLPLVASADENAGVAHCAAVAERFSSDPRSMAISELDQLRTCINVQVDAMGRDTSSKRPQLSMAQRYAKPLLRDDL
jgi:hypothetical protein